MGRRIDAQALPLVMTVSVLLLLGILAMIRVGEETNSLPVLLGTLARDTSDEVDYGIRQLNTVMEPLLILLVGILVGFVLVAMYLPMFKLGMTIG